MNKEKNHIKRFCFAGNKMSQLEHNQISFYAKLKSDNRLSEMGIVNLDIFKNDLFCFFVLDIQIHLSLDDLKNLLEQKMKTYPELKFLFKLINLEKHFLLDIIFKKEYVKQVLKHKGQIIPQLNNYLRIIMTLEIKNEPQLLEAYINQHTKEKIWPQIIENMNIIGIKDMEIYAWGYQMFLIMDTSTTFNLDKDGAYWASLPKEQEWQLSMAKYQKVNPNSKALEKWIIMKNVI